MRLVYYCAKSTISATANIVRKYCPDYCDYCLDFSALSATDWTRAPIMIIIPTSTFSNINILIGEAEACISSGRCSRN
jgi:hypothetical protein